MVLIDKDTELTAELISKIIMRFDTEERPKLQRYFNYYMGKQDIQLKYNEDNSKPCNRIITNYCDNIVNNYNGYLTGIPVTYKSNQDIAEVQEVLNYNDVKTEDSELLRNALIYGRAYEINYIDEDGKQRFTVIDTIEGVPVYENTLSKNLLYFIRYYLADTITENSAYSVEVYSNSWVRKYTCDNHFSALQFEEETPHYFQQVPITVFTLNSDEVSIFDKVMSLQDAYNKLVSSEVDDFEAFCDAYLIFKGVEVEAEELQGMKTKRTIILPEEGAEASYLTKSVSDTQIENMLKNINDTIHKISNSPDFSQESFGTSSGIALRFRLLGFENKASAIAANMVKALQKRIELICQILNVKGLEEVWRDIDIIISRNIPVNEVEAANMVNTLRGLVSDRTLLTRLPFIDDVDGELEALQAQKVSNMEMYAFGAPADEAAADEADEGGEKPAADGVA